MATTFWPNYLFFTDFSNDADTLSKIPVGVLSAEDAKFLSASLSSFDKGEHRGDWTDVEEAAYTLAGANVVFNGENHTSFPSNALYKYALIVELPWAAVPHNLLVVQYNDQPDLPQQ
ncbi:hypothetical protein [Burkholderia phage FLC9]|nr:hypothetical protein [Burkholderia phage FLC9]